jgi:hypothetical protein
MSQTNNFPKHHALATGKQNKQGAIPGGKPVKAGQKVAGHK